MNTKQKARERVRAIKARISKARRAAKEAQHRYAVAEGAHKRLEAEYERRTVAILKRKQQAEDAFSSAQQDIDDLLYSLKCAVDALKAVRS